MTARPIAIPPSLPPERDTRPPQIRAAAARRRILVAAPVPSRPEPAPLKVGELPDKRDFGPQYR